VPDNHVEFESIAALDAWKEAHPELAPQPEPAPNPVPDEVPMWALKEVCLLHGHAHAIDTALGMLPEPQQSIARNRWDNKDTISRGSPHIAAMQQLLNWDEACVDELFRNASNL
jgi:hypothetical protein